MEHSAESTITQMIRTQLLCAPTTRILYNEYINGLYACNRTFSRFKKASVFPTILPSSCRMLVFHSEMHISIIPREVQLRRMTESISMCLIHSLRIFAGNLPLDRQILANAIMNDTHEENSMRWERILGMPRVVDSVR